MTHVSIIGAGAWGTALALAVFRAGAHVTLWSIRRDEVESINQNHENVSRLPGIKLDSLIYATLDAEEASKADVVIFVPPAQYMRSVCETFRKILPLDVPLIIASKGIEDGTFLLMSEVLREVFPNNPLLVLSGPSFASEVARGLPTAVDLAAEDIQVSQKIAHLLSSPSFRLSPTEDIIGTQVGSACKNVIAIACGILEGRQLGDNARAAAVAGGLTEIAQLGEAMGGKLETFLGLAGVGDVTLTSLSSQSRNKSFGMLLGQGLSLEEVLARSQTLTEGIYTISGTVALAEKYQINMPITFALKDFLQGKSSLDSFVEAIFTSSLKKKVA